MPIYEYKCEKCEHIFDEVLSVSNRDKPIEEPCPECGKKSIKKLISATTMGVDMNVKPPGWFQDRLSNMKDYTPKRYHDGLDKAGNRSGGKLGPH